MYTFSSLISLLFPSGTFAVLTQGGLISLLCHGYTVLTHNMCNWTMCFHIKCTRLSLIMVERYDFFFKKSVSVANVCSWRCFKLNQPSHSCSCVHSVDVLYRIRLAIIKAGPFFHPYTITNTAMPKKTIMLEYPNSCRACLWSVWVFRDFRHQVYFPLAVPHLDRKEESPKLTLVTRTWSEGGAGYD